MAVGFLGEHCYKYRTCQHMDRLESIILKHELYVPTANQLNDPSDCRPRLAMATPDAKATFLTRMWKLYRPGASPQELASIHRGVLRGIERIGEDAFHEEFATTFYASFTKRRVYSMSKRWDNFNLWAKYADEHRGYCLEFSANFHPFRVAWEVQYGDFSDFDLTEPNASKTAHFPYLWRKRGEWSGEEEVRVLRPAHECPRFTIEPESLTRIILGKDIAAEHEARIRSMARERVPSLDVFKGFHSVGKQALLLKR